MFLSSGSWRPLDFSNTWLEGGHTIFPLAELPGEAADQSFSEARPLGEMLLQATVQHTGQAWSRDTLEVQERSASTVE